MPDAVKKPCSVLFLDDSQDDRYFFHRAVARTQTPFIIHAFFSPDPAVAYLQNQWPIHNSSPHVFPTLVICDWDLGHSRTGCEVVTRIRQLSCCKTLPIIMLSDTTAPDAVSCCYAAGANAFLQKASHTSRWQELVTFLYVGMTVRGGDLSLLADLPEYVPPDPARASVSDPP